VTAWLETIAGPNLNWLRAPFTLTTIVQGTSYIDNPICRLLAPRCGQQVDISFEGSSPTALTVFGAARSYDVHKLSFKAIEIKFNAASSLIDVTIFEDRRDISVPLSLQFQYRPSMAWTPIHEITHRRNTRIKQFYWKLWYGDDEELPDIGVHETFTGPEITIQRFCAVVENEDGSSKSARNADMKAPMDFAIVTGWQVCAKHSSFLVLC
jgi:fatty acid synthase subunit alpha